LHLLVRRVGGLLEARTAVLDWRCWSLPLIREQATARGSTGNAGETTLVAQCSWRSCTLSSAR